MQASAATFGIRGAIGFKSVTSAMNRWCGCCPIRRCGKPGLCSHPKTHERSSTRSDHNLQQRLNDLFGHVRHGKIIEAMNEFYDKDTVMQDNANPPTKGLA
ncbi:MAG: hypothetical protein P0120_22215 [Nitrospira sp.]|nr:hypothetical protein [Nitrospira sp.]